MSGKTVIDFIILVITFGCSFILIGYEDDAKIRGWPVVAWLSGDAPFLKLLAFVTVLLTLGVPFYLYSWWSPFVVLIVGFLFGFTSTQILKSKVQFVAILGTVVGWVLCLTYVL